MTKQRIDKVLSNLGYGSRANIKKDCKKGIITVNGEIIKDPSKHIIPEKDIITYAGEKVNYRSNIYIMMNKPNGVVSATHDNIDTTVIDLLDEELRVFDLFPVGRLDKDTEGMMIITNDGKMAHRVLSPVKHVPKTYFAIINSKISNKDINDFLEGVVLEDGYKTKPAKLCIINNDLDNNESEIELTISEGKFHQVKRMFESIGKKVIYLKRISMGQLKLDNELELGEYRELTDEELNLLEKKDGRIITFRP